MMYLETHDLSKNNFYDVEEDLTVYYVEVIDSVNKTIITETFCGSDYQLALMQKDRLDLVWDDGSTYTRITEDFMTEEELNEK